MGQKNIVIWGAGRIGRGFIADLFFEAGYEIVFVDQAPDLIQALNSTGAYPVIRARGPEDVETVDIQGFAALHTSETKELQKVIDQTGLIALSVYPKNFEEAAAQLQRLILNRREAGFTSPLDILLCTNLIHAGPRFSALLQSGLNSLDKEWMERNVGVVETLIIRISPDMENSAREKSPLTVLTNGYPVLHVDKLGFRGEFPQMFSIRLVEDMRAEEIRKIYTYNMAHAVLAYHGTFKGHALLVECLNDEKVMAEAKNALAEISAALQKEFAFTKAEMQQWISNVISHTNNPIVKDTVERSAADPLRKLQHDDRLIGPARLCLKHGIQPKAIIRAIAAAFHYTNTGDHTSANIQAMIATLGLDAAIRKVCGLVDSDSELIEAIKAAYYRVPLEYEWASKAEKACELGYHYEKVYHGCGQSVIAAVTETLGIFDEAVFRSATGLCGGIGLVNEATCSALTGGAMAIGLVFYRSREHFDGDRQEKYTNFALVQKLRERVVQEYGSALCCGIHKKLYGRAYDLRSKSESSLFEEAGAHEDGCTCVVGNCARWTIEILSEELIERAVKSKMEKPL